MNSALNRLVAVFVSCLLLPGAHAASNARIDYREKLQQLEIDRAVTIDTMRFNAMGRQFDMELAPNHRVLNSVARSQLGDNIAVYRGKIAGNASSWVRLTFVDGMPNGMFSDGITLYAIETDTSAPDAPYIFRLDDLILAPGTFSCSSYNIHDPKNAGELFLTVAEDIQKTFAQGLGATSNLNIDVIADQMFTDAKTDAQASMITRINNVDGIFSSQVGVQLTIGRSDVFTAADDPFSGATDSGDLLDELSDFRRDVPSAQRGGLTHLFTGRNLTSTDPDTGEVSTGNVGIAYRGALCSRNAGAGITEARFSVTTDSLIAAHEIGHNFGAPHDGTSGSACSAEAQTFIMAPSVNGSDQFSACSIQQMDIEIASAPCLTPLAAQDVAVTGNPSGDILLGSSTTVTFDVDSAGTDDATNVNFEVTIPASVTLDNVSSSIGSCSSGSGTASCSIGTIAAGSGATVTLNVTPTTTGSKSLAATASAASDDNAGNNQASVNLTVNAAIDLVASTTAAQVVIDNSVSASITVENRGPSTATSTSVSVTPDSGLSVDSASFGGNACTITSNVATCDVGNLAANSSSSISAAFTGTTLGAQTYEVAATASQTDTNTGNNNTTGQVTVNSATTTTTTSDSGGGGSIGWLVLLLLSTLCWWRLDFAILGNRPM